mgnify:CR=1 FL=1
MAPGPFLHPGAPLHHADMKGPGHLGRWPKSYRKAGRALKRKAHKSLFKS